jgi:hypothetical protein
MATVTFPCPSGLHINDYLHQALMKTVDGDTVKAKFNDISFTLEPGMMHDEAAQIYDKKYQKLCDEQEAKEQAAKRVFNDKLADYEFLYSFARKMYENLVWRPDTANYMLREELTILRRR